MSRISLCVIARNEEALLPGMLASLDNVADEIIVVDTGSNDKTAAIATAAGGKLVEMEWKEDFAEARNVALSHATMDWVLVLDCDERLAPGSAEAIRNAVQNDAFDLGMIALHNSSNMSSAFDEVLSGKARQGEPVLVPRLFRRCEDLRWQGAIHESVSHWLAQSARRVVTIDADIVHLGYTPEILETRQKDARNLKMLERRVLAEPNNVTVRTYLAQAYLQSGQAMKSVENIELAWTALASNRQQKGMRYSIVPLATLRTYVKIRTDRISEALDTLNQAREWGADHPNLDMLQGVCFETQALNEMGAARQTSLNTAKTFFESALRAKSTPRSNESMPGASSWASYTRLGTVRLMLGELNEAMDAFNQAVEIKPDHVEAHLGLAEAILFAGDPDKAIDLLQSHMKDEVPDAWVIGACAADIRSDTETMRVFTQKAWSMRQKAFVAPHRRIQLEALRCAASIYSGSPETGPGTLGVIGALMGKIAIDESEVLVQKPNSTGIKSLVRNVIQSGQSHLLDSLFTRRAEALIPGIGEMVRAEVELIGGSVDDDGEPEYLFIGGAGRSGTTLFRAMLDAHPNIHIGPERKLIRRMCAFRKEWDSVSDTLDAAGLTSDVLDNATKAFISTLMEANGKGAKRIGEKTPPNLLCMETLGRLYPEAKFIHVIRDGRAVSASLLQQNWLDMNTGKKIDYCQDPIKAAQYWAAVVTEIRAQAATVPGRYMEVRYEDLVSNPKETMMRVLAFLEEPWDSSVLAHQNAAVDLPDTESSSEAVSKPVNTGSIHKWKSQLDDRQTAQIEKHAGSLLKALGYAA